MRGKRLLAAGIVTVLAVGLVVSRVPAGSAASLTRYSPGVLQLVDDSSLNMQAYNPTTKDVAIEFSIDESNGFTLTTPQTDGMVEPGTATYFSFACTTGPCLVVPIIKGPKGLVVSAQYKLYGAADITEAPSGDWSIVK